MTMTRDPIAPEDDAAADSRARPWAAGHVIVAVLVALVLGTLLNAQDLLATAERQPFGWQRDVAVAAARPVAQFSAAIGLDRPRNAIDTALGRNEGDGPVVDEQPEPDPPVIAAPEGEGTESPTDGADAQPTATPTPTEPAGPMGLDRGPVTADDPLELYIGGDSMVEIQFGTALEDLADDTGMIETLKIDFDRGSGLSRPDFVDWPKRLAGASQELDPDVMVVYFGGNDAQPLEIDGAVYEPLDPEWQDEYRSRVADLQDQLADAGHHVYWMGLPIPRSETLAEKFQMMNEIYRTEAETRDAITFVSLWDRFANGNGSYSEYLPNRAGDDVDMRLDDGIHYTTNGAYHAARPTIQRIMEDFDIEPVEDGGEG